MKSKLFKKIFVLIFFLFIDNNFSQTLIAEYESVNIFSDVNKPISVGILKLDGEVVFEDQLLEELGKVITIRENFIFYPSQTLESLKEDLNIETLDVYNLDVLNKLKENLDIQIILVGNEMGNSDILINLVDTGTGDTIFTNVYKTSKNSTPLEDIIKLFTEQKTTIYKREIKNLPDMVLVGKGEIVVRPIRYPTDTIRVNDNFYISKFECTVQQFAEFIQVTGYKTDAENEGFSLVYLTDNNYKLNSAATWKCDENGSMRTNFENIEYPVVHISWNDAMKYCEWLTNETGEKFRLPKFNEWQFAAYGGVNPELFIYSGGDVLDSVGWFKENSELKLHKVGEKQPNQLGLYDMSGNVREWCSDPFKTDDSRRKVANGSWLDQENYCNNNFGHRWESNFRSNIIGFRVLKEIR